LNASAGWVKLGLHGLCTDKSVLRKISALFLLSTFFNGLIIALKKGKIKPENKYAIQLVLIVT
jgi:hypothetical protein